MIDREDLTEKLNGSLVVPDISTRTLNEWQVTLKQVSSIISDIQMAKRRRQSVLPYTTNSTLDELRYLRQSCPEKFYNLDYTTFDENGQLLQVSVSLCFNANYYDGKDTKYGTSDCTYHLRCIGFNPLRSHLFQDLPFFQSARNSYSVGYLFIGNFYSLDDSVVWFKRACVELLTPSVLDLGIY